MCIVDGDIHEPPPPFSFFFSSSLIRQYFTWGVKSPELSKSGKNYRRMTIKLSIHSSDGANHLQ